MSKVIMKTIMINNFLIINFIGKDDKLGLRINKDFFIHNCNNQKNKYEYLVAEIQDFLTSHNVIPNKDFSIIVNQGPGSFSGIRTSMAIAKGLVISKKTKLYGYKNTDLVEFNQENIEKLLDKNLVEKKLIKPIYIS